MHSQEYWLFPSLEIECIWGHTRSWSSRIKRTLEDFFRLEDQLKISSNETLKKMQEKLDLTDNEESEFYRQLQNQIEENDVKLGKKPRQSRKWS